LGIDVERLLPKIIFKRKAQVAIYFILKNKKKKNETNLQREIFVNSQKKQQQ